MIKNRPIPFGRPWITDADKQAVMDVLSGDILTHGPQCKAFEQEFATFMGGAGACLSVSSGMAALHLSYLAMGLGTGDEVLVSALTHVATAHAVEAVGAKPVFVDCDPQTGNMDPNKIEPLITKRTKAIGLVHYVGIPCDMDAIGLIAKDRNLKIVEDCALAVGSRFKGTHVGLFGESGCYSFYPVKHMTTGEGGMFVSRHPEVIKKVQGLRAFGVNRSFTERKLPGMYDVPTLGLNYRMSDINAALGRAQVRRLPEIMKRRQTNFQTLKKTISTIGDLTVLDSPNESYQNSYYCLTVVLQGHLGDKRDDIVSKLKSQGLGTSVYYPQPVPRMTYYHKKYGIDPPAYKEAAKISDRSIAFPVGPHLNEGDIDFILQIFIDIVKEI